MLDEVVASGERALIATRVLERMLDGDEELSIALYSQKRGIEDDLGTIEAALTAGWAEPQVTVDATIGSRCITTCGTNRHGLDLVVHVLEQPSIDPDGRANLLSAAGTHAAEINDLATASTLLDQADAIADPDDAELHAWIDGRRGLIVLRHGDLPEAKEAMERSLAGSSSPMVRGGEPHTPVDCRS